MKNSIIFATIMILVIFAIAEIPASLAYQGKITDADGVGINGTMPFTIRTAVIK